MMSRLGQLTSELLATVEPATMEEVLAEHLPGLGIDQLVACLYVDDADDRCDERGGPGVGRPGRRPRVAVPTRDFPPPWLRSGAGPSCLCCRCGSMKFDFGRVRGLVRDEPRARARDRGTTWPRRSNFRPAVCGGGRRPRAGRGGEPPEEQVPLDGEPRAADTAQRGRGSQRHDPARSARCGGRLPGTARPGADGRERRAPRATHRRRAGPGQQRDGPAATDDGVARPRGGP